MENKQYLTFEQTDDMQEFYSSMVKCQSEMMAATKAGKVSAGQRSWNYAKIEDVYAVIKEVAPKNGFCFFQDLQTIDDKICIVTEVGHSSGQFRRTRVIVNMPTYFGPNGEPRQPTPQEWGSAFTYFRRYAILGAFAIETEDDDSQAASKTPERAQTPSAQQYKMQEPRRQAAAAPPLKNYAPTSPDDKAEQDIGSYVVTFGKFKNQALKDIDRASVDNYVEYLMKKSDEDNKPLSGGSLEFVTSARKFLASGARS